MSKRPYSWKRIFSLLLILAGATAVVIAFAADSLGFGGYPGLGPRQIILALVGACSLFVGIITRYDLPWKKMFSADSQAIGFGSMLRLALFFGLLSGIFEVAVLGFKKFYHGEFIFLSQDVIWMAPVADAVLFVCIGILLIPAILRKSELVNVTSCIWLFFSLGLLGVLLMIPKLHIMASLLLAGGIASRVAKSLSRRIGLLVGRGLMAVFVLIAMLGVVRFSFLWPTEQVEITQKTNSREQSANVLLIVLDTVRAKSLSLYGYEKATTPNLEKLVETSIIFDNAIATSPWTLPTHASLFTGKYHHELSVTWAKPLDAEFPTLAEVLSRNNYRTAGFVANYNYCGYESGLARGFQAYRDYPVSAGQILLSSSLGRTVINSVWLRDLANWHLGVNHKLAEDVNADFLSWQEKKSEQPFFAFLNYYDAHQPYFPPASYLNKFGHTEPRGKYRYQLNLAEVDNWYQMSPHQIQAEQNAYEAGIAYMDNEIDKLLQALSNRGVLENTIVIITGDHGEFFGEKDVFSHGSAVYMPGIHVPLLISYPRGMVSGKRISEKISLRDIPATVLELTGLSADSPFPGSSLTRVLNDEKIADNNNFLLSEVRVFVGPHKGFMKSILFDKFHYIRNGDDFEELYDLAADPNEISNLAELENFQQTLQTGRNILAAALGEDMSLAQRGN